MESDVNGISIGRLFVDNQKAALNMRFQDPVPHYQGPALAEGVLEANALSGRQRRLRMCRTKTTPAAVYQTAAKGPRVGSFQSKPYVAMRRAADFGALLH
jgi:hypothetical protein